MNAELEPQENRIIPAESVAAGTLPPAPLTPKQFGARYNKSASFGYRMIYEGRVKVLPDVQFAIPIAEVIKFESETVVYNGRKCKRKRRAQTKSSPNSSVTAKTKSTTQK